MKHIRIILRGLSILNKIEPVFAALNVIISVLEPLQAYINIFMLAFMVDELNSLKRSEVLLQYVIVTISLNLVYSLFLHILRLMKENHFNQFMKSESMFFARKSMEMDYEKVEDAEVFELLTRVKNENHNGYNMFYLSIFSSQLIKNITSVLTAAVICFGLFVSSSTPLVVRLASLTGIFIAVIINYFTARKMNSINFEMNQKLIPFNVSYGFYNDYYEDYNAGKDIRIYGLADYITDIQKNHYQRLGKTLYDAKGRSIPYLTLNNLASGIVCLLAYYLVFWGCSSGSVAIGDIAKLTSSMMMFAGAFSGVIFQFQSLINNNKYLSAYFSYFDIESSRKDKAADLAPETAGSGTNSKSVIELDNVSFRYPQASDSTLKNVSVSIQKGEKVAVVGENGSGKTTMIKLLCGLYLPTDGKVLFDGVSSGEYSTSAYYSRFAVVFQGFKLFAFSIRDNISSGKASDPSVIDTIAKEVNLDSLFAKLPRGADTHLYKEYEDDGIEPSGGEAQKIAIARALFKDTDVLVLDEPTSALDPVSESEIFDLFGRIMADKTVLFVSHRMAACHLADRILVMDHGMIIEQGSHEELRSIPNGKYAELWNAQSELYSTMIS